MVLFAVVSLFIIFTSSGSVTDTSCDDNENGDTSVLVDSKSKEENAKAIYDYVGSHIEGATPQGLAGMLGNFEQESQLDPGAIERPNDPLSGHGLAQWMAGRTTQLKNFASEKGKDWSNLGLQLEFLLHELNGSEKSGVNALKATTVEQATADWQTKFERAGTPAMGNRITFANKWYAKFGSSDPAAGSALETASDGESQSVYLACGSSSGESGDIVEMARQFIGWFHYSQPMRKQFGSVESPDKDGYTDCSSFVWLILTKAGYNTPADVGWFTGSMTADARGSKKYLQEVSESEAKAGDIIIVNKGSGAGNNGHTAILAEDWHGKETKIIQSGGGRKSISEAKVSNSFTSLLNGGDLCLARAVKK